MLEMCFYLQCYLMWLFRDDDLVVYMIGIG